MTDHPLLYAKNLRPHIWGLWSVQWSLLTSQFKSNMTWGLKLLMRFSVSLVIQNPPQALCGEDAFWGSHRLEYFLNPYPKKIIQFDKQNFSNGLVQPPSSIIFRGLLNLAWSLTEKVSTSVVAWNFLSGDRQRTLGWTVSTCCALSICSGGFL